MLEFARLAIDAFGGGEEPLVRGEFRLGDTRHTVSDISKLCALGWAPTIPVDQNVREYAEWMRTQRATPEYLTAAESIMEAQGVVRRIAR